MASNFTISKLIKGPSAAILTIGLTLTGCGLLNEPIAKFPSSSGNISSGAGCMRDSVETLGKYFSGQVSQVSITGAWVCFEDSVDLFSKKVRGENPTFYTSTELASFLESQVLDPGSKISSELLQQIMHLKQLFVGGTSDRLTFGELAEIKLCVGQLKVLFRELQPLMKILSLNWTVDDLSRDQIRSELATTETQLLQILENRFPLFKSSYSLGQIKLLADSLHANFPSSEGLRSFKESVDRFLPLAITAKKIILGSQNSVLEISEWSQLLEILPRLYARFLHYNYLLSQSDWFWGSQVFDLETIVLDTVSNFKQIVYGRGTGNPVGVSTAEFFELIDGLHAADLLTEFLTPQLLKSVTPLAFSRFLTPPEDRLKGVREKDLSIKVLDSVRVEVLAFFKSQKKLSGLYDQKDQWTHSELRSAFAGTSGAEEELLRIFQISAPLAFDSKERMYIRNGSEIPYDKKSALKLNLVRSFSRLMFRSYSKDLSRTQTLSHLTKDEIVTDAFTELRPVLVEAQLIEADNSTFLKSRFREANLFTVSGNGDNNLDFAESSTIALMIWSGLNLSNEFEPAIVQNCKTAQADVYDVPCSLNQIRLQVAQIATNIPLIAQTLTTLPPSQANQMLLEVLRSTGGVVNPNSTAKLSDLGLVPHLLQYIESIFRRWDTNKDGILDKPEAMIAEPTFRPLLAEISGQTSASVLRAGFAYVLIYQKNPADDVWDFFFFMNDEASWKINVDRPRLSTVLGFIADEMAKP